MARLIVAQRDKFGPCLLQYYASVKIIRRLSSVSGHLLKGSAFKVWIGVVADEKGGKDRYIIFKVQASDFPEQIPGTKGVLGLTTPTTVESRTPLKVYKDRVRREAKMSHWRRRGRLRIRLHDRG
jgi:hypothetical protein